MMAMVQPALPGRGDTQTKNTVFHAQTGNYIVRGDNTGAHKTYVWFDGTYTYSTYSLESMLALLRYKNQPIEIDRDAVAYLLHNSLIPTPKTIYKNIYVLGVGDQIRFDLKDRNGGPRFGCQYPYYQYRSTGLSTPSTKRLLYLLCGALEKNIRPGDAFMLSSGKDSTAIALGLNEAGLAKHVTAYTYRDADSDYTEEAEKAAALSQKLGIRHKSIEVPADGTKVKDALLHFFTHSPYPSCDPTTIPYAVGLHQEGIKNTGIIDGTRSDMSMGIVPGKNQMRLLNYYKKLGGSWPGPANIARHIPFHSKAVKFFSSYPEVSLYHHGHFRAGESRLFYDHQTDTGKFWMEVYDQQKEKPLIDAYTYINDQFFAGCGILTKIHTVTGSLGCDAILPWTDPALVEYLFNLLQDYKFNPKTRTNKILLRRLLKEKLNFEEDERAKKIFYFNMAGFVQKNLPFVKEEILSCTLWNSSMEQEFNHYTAMLDEYPRAGGALVDLFMISGFHNHCKYLGGK